ncbi:MAG: tandem-95 repeat protein, partial [Gammaproteobacteria bacterium]|nr:tandem-95 repeat protein [Gammaproteobacteria bacterium]
DALSVVSFVVNGVTYTAGTEVTLPGIGVLVINANGSYVFTPNDNWNGSVPEVTYTTNTQASSTLNITVEPVNDIPVAVDNYYSLDEGGTVSSNLITGDANGSAAGGVDYDLDGDTLTITAINGVPLVFDETGTAIVAVDYGTLEIHRDGTFTYTHDGSQPVIPTNFTYTITDGQGASSVSTANVGMDVDNVNDVPVAVDNYYSLDEGTSVSGNLITDDANGATPGGVDYDLDGDTLTITAINGVPVVFDSTGKATVAVDYGLLEIHTDGSFTYTHDGSQPVIPTNFTYTITDGQGASSTSTANVGMDVANVNDIPLAVNDVNNVTEDASITRPAVFGVLSNDTDADGDSLTVTDIRTGTEAGTGTAGSLGSGLTGTYGTLILQSDGSYSYVADQAAADALAQGQSATDIFTYTIEDGNGGSDKAQLVITVIGTNDGPKFEDEGTDDTGAVVEDLNPVAGNLSDSGTIIFDDADLLDTHIVSVAKTGGALGGTLTAAITDPATGEGTGTISWTYSVANSATQYLAVGQTVTETFTVTIDDGHGGTADQLVTVTITGTNDVPTITSALTDALGAVTEDATTPNLTDSGTITFDDIDLIDVHSATVAKNSGTLGGSLVASV